MPLPMIGAKHGAADTSPGDVDAPSSDRLAELVFQSALLRSDGWPDRQLKSVQQTGKRADRRGRPGRVFLFIDRPGRSAPECSTSVAE
jgi:hypothetical protein